MKNLLFIALMISILSCSHREVVPTVKVSKRFSMDDKLILVIVDGKQVSSTALHELDPNRIESIQVLKGNDIKKYTNKNYEGVILVKMKKI